MRRLYNKFVNWLLGIDAKLRLNFTGGAFVAAFFGLALGITLCIWPVIFVSFGKEFFLCYTDKDKEGGKFRWKHFAASRVGAALVQLFVLLHLWIFPSAV